MKKYKNFINEYYSSYRFGENETDTLEGDNNFLTKIIEQPKMNIKETMFYRWMVAKSLTYENFVSVVNNIYDLGINFNQSLENSDDELVKELEMFWVEFNYETMEFFKFKNKLIKITKKYDS